MNNEADVHWFKVLLSGEFVTHDFVSRQIKLVLLFIVLSILYTWYGYFSQAQIREVNQLREQVKAARYEQLVWSCEYVNHTRPVVVQEKLRRHGRKITLSNCPPSVL